MPGILGGAGFRSPTVFRVKKISFWVCMGLHWNKSLVRVWAREAEMGIL